MFYMEDVEDKENNISSFYTEPYKIKVNKISLTSNTYTFIYTNRAIIQKCIYCYPERFSQLLEFNNL